MSNIISDTVKRENYDHFEIRRMSDCRSKYRHTLLRTLLCALIFFSILGMLSTFTVGLVSFATAAIGSITLYIAWMIYCLCFVDSVVVPQRQQRSTATRRKFVCYTDGN